jgi:esterase/lipase superfamily enzyme
MRLKPNLSLLVAALFCAGLAGCGGRVEGVLLPVAGPVSSTNRVDMLVATTRMKSAVPGEMFTGERGLTPSYAEIVVSIPPEANRKVGEVQWPSAVPGNPATDFVTLSAKELTRPEARDRFHEMVRATPKHSVILFIHGFNNRFDDAVFRFAQIVHDSRVQAVPALFAWPSRGTVWAYGYDRESTNYSRDALEELLQVLAKDPSVGEVSVLAHSMGNWLTLEALRQMAIRNGRVNPKIRAVMLAAPDVDVTVFRRQIAQIGTSGPKFTLFVSQDDRALAISRRVWGNIPRLGAIDPTVEPYLTELSADKITVIDLTKLQSGDRLNHGKFAESPEVVQLIGSRLASGQTVTDSRVGLGDRIAGVATGAAATVGSAAGLVLSAPLVIIDPATRANYGAHAGQLGESLSDTAAGATP